MSIPEANPPPGAVLGTERLRQLLVQEHVLFREGTWSDDRIRPAGYDLVVAPDDLRVPDPSGGDELKVYRRGEEHPDSAFALEPGDFAFVTSKEEVCLPWGIAGNIGIKNRFARKGLLVLTGLLVDPGYGMRQEGHDWVPNPKRLHFGIANVGRESVSISFEKDRVASIQFLEVAGDTARMVTTPSQDVAKGFLLFKKFDERIEQVKGDLAHTQAKVDSVLLFGLYVILATLLGALAAIFLGAVGNNDLSTFFSRAVDTVSTHPWASLAVLTIVVSGTVLVVSLVLMPVLKPFTRLIVGKGPGRKKKDSS